MEFNREIKGKIEKNLFKGKIILIYGPRRAGKTYLTKQILKNYPEGKYINCELQENIDKLSTTYSQKIAEVVGMKKNLVILDEAHTILQIGQVLKIIADTFPEVQVIATGSSSFDLIQKTSESLIGRSINFMLLPLSLNELGQAYSIPELDSRVSLGMRYGHFPSVVGKDEDSMKDELQSIAVNYLYKDILSFERVRKPRLVSDLVKALALQVGSEVSLNELATLLHVGIQTIDHYLSLLEQSFIIFRLNAFSRNPRKEIAKKFKIYFYDLGIRNTIISNFNDLDKRDDVGALWENFCIVERLKNNSNNRRLLNTYFWRSYSGSEIDYLEESNGNIAGFECKWKKPNSFTSPPLFRKMYSKSIVTLVTPENYREIILSQN